MEATLEQVNTGTIIHFITMYSRLEKKTLTEGFDLIKYLFKEDREMASHLCDHWRSKKKEFGSFYLNLSYASQIKFLEYWGIESDEYKVYLQKMEDDYVAAMFDGPPRPVKVMNNVVLFFGNHGISEKVYDDIHLTNVPKSSNKRFGNSTNWADYILSLPMHQQMEVLKKIAAHYDKE